MKQAFLLLCKIHFSTGTGLEQEKIVKVQFFPQKFRDRRKNRIRSFKPVAEFALINEVFLLP